MDAPFSILLLTESSTLLDAVNEQLQVMRDAITITTAKQLPASTDTPPHQADLIMLDHRLPIDPTALITQHAAAIGILLLEHSKDALHCHELLHTDTKELMEDPVYISPYVRLSLSLKQHQHTLARYQQREQELAQRVEQQRLELKQTNKRLRYLSRYDPLTGVANHVYFHEIFELERARALRESLPLTLLLLDIDHFKGFNDYYGHSTGDLCLKLITQTIRQCTRRPTDFMARCGGEEFIILLPNTDIDGGIILSKKIQTALGELPDLPLNPKTQQALTVSIGVSGLAPGQSLSTDTLMDEADKALYQAKANGRNQVAQYH